MGKQRKDAIIVESRGENDEIIEHRIDVNPVEWINKLDDSLAKGLWQNKGLGFMHPGYLVLKNGQDENKEYVKIAEFIVKYMLHYAKENNMKAEDLKLEFINHGKTELVFVLTDTDGKMLTLLVKQPAVTMGEVHEEMLNLQELNKRDKRVVAPIEYFMDNNQELYVTPYINQARCIASSTSWGVYIPEPFYRFEEFSVAEENIINACMIAKLISLYDLKKNEGISLVKLGGGDFMLPKGYEGEEITIDSIYDKLYLIAARKKVKCSLDDYIEIIRNEFSRATINEDSSKLVMNIRGRVAMNKEQIEKGIELGLKKLYGFDGLKEPKSLKK